MGGGHLGYCRFVRTHTVGADGANSGAGGARACSVHRRRKSVPTARGVCSADAVGTHRCPWRMGFCLSFDLLKTVENHRERPTQHAGSVKWEGAVCARAGCVCLCVRAGV